MIWVGSVLGVLGKREEISEFANNQLCRTQSRLRNFGDMFNPTRAGISEVVIAPNSRWIKQLVGDLRLRKRFGISVLAVTRGEVRSPARELSSSARSSFISRISRRSSKRSVFS